MHREPRTSPWLARGRGQRASHSVRVHDGGQAVQEGQSVEEEERLEGVGGEDARDERLARRMADQHAGQQRESENPGRRPGQGPPAAAGVEVAQTGEEEPEGSGRKR